VNKVHLAEMEIKMFKYPIIDSHIHMYSEADLEAIETAAREGGYSKYTLLSGSLFPQRAPGNLSVAWAKLKHPGKVYGYATFHMQLEGTPDGEDLLKQAKEYHAIGFDGIKMLDGKPSLRKERVPIDNACYDPLFSYLEENQIPVLYHSNDPIEFWDIEKIPEWAKDIYYYDWKEPSKDQITKETAGILKKHPDLNLTVAHFFFLPNTDEYDLACELMETYPNFCMDLTPGWEMFQDIHRMEKEWKSYIKKYSDRLMYGTDIGGVGNNLEERIKPLRRVFETDDVFPLQDYTCYGLDLDDTTLKNIYAQTYRTRIQKNDPAGIDVERLAAYKKELGGRIEAYKKIDKTRAVQDMERFWELIKETKGGNGNV